MTISDRDKLECAERELKMRQRVYPRWVEQGKMSQKKADHEIMVMQFIVADYQSLVNFVDDLQNDPQLF